MPSNYDAPFNLLAFYVFDTRVLKSIFNKYGLPIHSDLRNNSRLIVQSTQLDRRLYAKVTISANCQTDLDEGMKRLSSIINGWPIRHVKSNNHCNICFEETHTTSECTKCECCLQMGHIINDCPLVRETSLEKEQNSVSENSQIQNLDENNRQKRSRHHDRDFHRNNHWKMVDELNFSMLENLVPIGPDGQHRKTISIYIDVNSTLNGNDPEVTVAGWFNNHLRAIKIYSDYFKSNVMDPRTSPKSWTQDRQYNQGKPLETIKQNLLKICANKRVLILDSDNGTMKRLTFTERDLRQANIELVNLTKYFGLISIASLINFYYPGVKISTDRPLNSPNSCFFACYMVKIYRKYLSLIQENKSIPPTDTIRNMLIWGKNSRDWEYDQLMAAKQHQTDFVRIKVSTSDLNIGEFASSKRVKVEIEDNS